MYIVIEKAKGKQSLDILTLNKKVWYQAYKHIVDKEQMDKRFERRFSEEGIKRFSDYVDRCDNFYVAISKENEQIVGYIDFGTCLWESKYKDYGEIRAIYVSPECQRCGIGQQLLDFAIDYFKEKGKSKIMLTTFQKNIIGLSFYKNNDFIIVDNLSNITGQDDHADEVLLFKDL